jgi:hypothetical protein
VAEEAREPVEVLVDGGCVVVVDDDDDDDEADARHRARAVRAD